MFQNLVIEMQCDLFRDNQFQLATNEHQSHRGTNNNTKEHISKLNVGSIAEKYTF
jgi:hypothetical protein